MVLFLIIIGTLILGCILFCKSGNRAAPVSNRIPSDLYAWLEMADESYIRTYFQKDTCYFAPYATDSIINDLYDDITIKPERLFGTRRYRNREWTLLEVHTTGYVLKKVVTHQHINVGAGIMVPLGDNITQEWTVEKIYGKYTVTDIKDV